MADTQADMVAVLERLVTAETPSNDPDLIAAGMRLAAQVIEEIIGIAPRSRSTSMDGRCFGFAAGTVAS